MAGGAARCAAYWHAFKNYFFGHYSQGLAACTPCSMLARVAAGDATYLAQDLDLVRGGRS